MGKLINSIQKLLIAILRKPHLFWQQTRPDGELRLFCKQPWLIVLDFLLLITYIFLPVKVVVICLVSLSCVLTISWWWGKTMARHLHAVRKLQYAALQVGDEMEENITVVNQSWLPVLWLRIEDKSDFPDYSIRSVRALDPNSRLTWRNHFICQQRGVFSLGPWEIVTGDPFGLFETRILFTAVKPMMVYPPLAVLPAELLPYGKQKGDIRPLNQPVIAESVLSSHTRLYQPGDPLRRIHWPTSARRDHLYVKTLDPEAASRIWLIPDLDPLVHYGSGNDSSEETLILLLVALANHLLGETRAVGLYSDVEPVQIILPQRGPAQLWSLLAALTPLHTTQTTPFAHVLSRAANLISSRDLVIALTPSLDPEWMRALSLISRGQGRSEAWAFILDPFSFGGQQSAAPLLANAAALGISARIVHRGEVEAQPGSYGALRRWEFITLGTGKVVVRNSPRQKEGSLNPLETVSE
jgi:uncharacterized protein (DUF58 family)